MSQDNNWQQQVWQQPAAPQQPVAPAAPYGYAVQPPKKSRGWIVALVAVVLVFALLALGIRGIRLGPTLPAFLSPGVAAVLQEKYDLRPITTPEEDIAACLGRH